MVDRSAADGTAVRDSAYLFYVLLLFAPGPLVTLLEGQFSLVGRQAYSAKAGAEYLKRQQEDVSDFIPADVVENRTDFGIFERAPQRGINYAAYPATCSAMRAQRSLGFHLAPVFFAESPSSMSRWLILHKPLAEGNVVFRYFLPSSNGLVEVP